jgi:hypothetical protein
MNGGKGWIPDVVRYPVYAMRGCLCSQIYSKWGAASKKGISALQLCRMLNLGYEAA